LDGRFDVLRKHQLVARLDQQMEKWKKITINIKIEKNKRKDTSIERKKKNKTSKEFRCWNFKYYNLARS
jgi:hypothetical protein